MRRSKLVALREAGFASDCQPTEFGRRPATPEKWRGPKLGTGISCPPWFAPAIFQNLPSILRSSFSASSSPSLRFFAHERTALLSTQPVQVHANEKFGVISKLQLPSTPVGAEL